MITVEKATRIAAPADRVWWLFSTQDGQRRAEKGLVSSIEFAGEGLGMVRVMRIGEDLDAGYLTERLDHYDEANMEAMFRIVDTGDLVPLADFCAHAKIIPAGPAACILRIRWTFVPVDMSEAQARDIVDANYQLFIANVHAAMTEDAKPPPEFVA